VLRGGTGVAALTAGSYLIGNGTGAIVVKTPAQVLGDIGAAAAVHSHEISAVNGLSAALDARPLQTSVTAQISAAVNALIDGAPGAIDTLNELAAAMGDDPNFAATVTNALAGKAALSGANFTGAVTTSASLRSTGASTAGFTGPGVELYYYVDGTANLLAYNRTANAYIPLLLRGTTVKLQANGDDIATVSSSGLAVIGSVSSSSNNFIGGANAVNLAPAGPGTVYFRPNGFASSAGQTTISATGAITASGAFSCLTFNATGSDIRLKNGVKLFAPRPLHRLLSALPDSHGAIVSYIHRVDGAYRIGPIAQDMERVEPAYMGTIEIEEGQVEGIAAGTYKTVDKASAAYEEAMWAGQEIDRLLARIEALESR
jgi:hypothetical protein